MKGPLQHLGMAVTEEQISQAKLMSRTILKSPVEFTGQASAIAAVKVPTVRVGILKSITGFQVGIDQLSCKRHVIEKITDDIFIQGQRSFAFVNRPILATQTSEDFRRVRRLHVRAQATSNNLMERSTEFFVVFHLGKRLLIQLVTAWNIHVQTGFHTRTKCMEIVVSDLILQAKAFRLVHHGSIR